METLLTRCRERYDLLLVDIPPALRVADVIPLLGQVDGVLVVASMGQTTRAAAAELRKRLRASRARVLGVVVNRDGTRRGTYGPSGASGQAAVTGPSGRVR